MEYIKLIILGILQGIAEFLPISSSGHLVVAEKLLKIEQPNLFVAEMLHFGTFLSVVFVFRKDIWKLCLAFFRLVKDIAQRKQPNDDDYTRLGLFILFGSVPTALIALAFEPMFKGYYESLKSIAVFFLLTAIMLYCIDKMRLRTRTAQNLGFWGAFATGCVQGIAILPGISRSGSTIFAASWLGLEKSEAARFSFLLSLPATFGAFLFGMKDALHSSAEVAFSLPLIVGVLVAAIVGVVALKSLLQLLSRKKMTYFSVYLVILSLVLLFVR